MMTMKKILYFEGAGWSEADSSKATDVGNCRIRTAFHLDDGRPVYLEIIQGTRPAGKNKKVPPVYYGWVDFLHYITDDEKNDDCNKHRLPQERKVEFDYSREAILNFVNGLGASFDEVVVVPDLGGYRVHRDEYSPKGTERVNYGDAFRYDAELTAKREAVHAEIYAMERAEGKQFPNFSLWADQDDPEKLHLLRHFNGYNKHWTINAAADDWKETMTECKLGRYGC